MDQAPGDIAVVTEEIQGDSGATDGLILFGLGLFCLIFPCQRLLC